MKFRREPVAGAGHSRWHRRSGKGVSANSRILPHRYADEGDKGPALRREIRRKERRLWVGEMNADTDD